MYITYKDSTPPNKPTPHEYKNKIKVVPYSKNFFYIKTGVVPIGLANPYIENNLLHLRQIMKDLAEECMNTPKEYRQFQIPKSSGGFRTISAPEPETKALLIKIKLFFERDLHLLPTNHAYAYVPGRSARDAIVPHVRHKSVYYLKLDIKDFFTNCTKDFLLNQLKQLQTIDILHDLDSLTKIIDFSTLNGGLPQGSPASPILTNLAMIPIDNYIAAYCHYNNMVYTRYADDILISKQTDFIFTEVSKKIQDFLAPTFQINWKKRRYGTNKGRNWNLGLMVNKDNNITIGYRNKERFRAAINNFFYDLTTGNKWSIVETQQLQGLISYYSAVNKEMVENIIEKAQAKYNLNLRLEFKKIINNQ